MGRPTDYTPAIADAICERLADGESLRAICSSDDMPNRATVFRWLARDEEFRGQYARAREAQADAIADEIVFIADAPLEAVTTLEKMVAVAQGGNMGSALEPVTETHTKDAVERSKLMVDARKWFAGKLNPKKYGPRIEHDGSIGLRHEDAVALLDDEDGRDSGSTPA